MFWANFLHLYQPYNQQEDILKAIVNQSYRPLLGGIKAHPKVRLTLNVSGGLLELFEKYNYSDLIDTLREVGERGQVEFTGSAKYHAFLPLLPESEIRRQIAANEDTCKRILGSAYKPKGFFTPEMAFSYKVARIAFEFGFSWIAAPEMSYGSERPEFNRIYQLSYRVILNSFQDPRGQGRSEGIPKQVRDDTAVSVYFRDKRPSVLILSGICRTPESLYQELKEELSHGKNWYAVTVMDGETFGHHRPGLQNFLFELWEDFEKGNKSLVPVQVSDLSQIFHETQEITLREATWSNEEQDFWLDREKRIASKNPFLLWHDSGNPIHQKQWEFVDFVVSKMEEMKPTELVKAQWQAVDGPVIARSEKTPRCRSGQAPQSLIEDGEIATSRQGGTRNDNCSKWRVARDLLDKALGSDQFWWASAKPWWSLEMIEAGAFYVKEAFLAIPGITDEDKRIADDYYRSILDEAFRWQREGIIRKKHAEMNPLTTSVPFKDRTSSEWFNQWILEFEDEMKKAAERMEFEKAIKWRDAIIKLKEGTDIYDALHIVNDLWTVRQIPSLKPYLEHKEDEISEFAKKHMR